jgi:hypothetical protein
MVWPWQEFNWGVFWAIIAAGLIYLTVANIFNFIVAKLTAE